MEPVGTESKVQGSFVVLEGIDGSGKGTQFGILSDALREAGYDVAVFDFPQYGQPSSHFVKRYLNGDYGTVEEVGPYTASLFYALDRFDVALDIAQAVADGKVVLANRFSGSNMAHQGAKFSDPEQRRGFFIWLDNLEFETLRIPRPDMNLVLRVPPATAQQLVGQKEARDYTDKRYDLHEADLDHLGQAATIYDDLCQLFPKDFSAVECTREGKLLPVETISKLIWEKLQSVLPPAPGPKGRSPSASQPPTDQSRQVIAAATVSRTSQDSQEGTDDVKPADANKHTGTTTQRTDAANSSSQIVRHDEGTGYQYYVPESLDKETATRYRQTMEELASRYSIMVRQLTGQLRQHSDVPAAKRGKAWKQSTRARALAAAQGVLPLAANPAVLELLPRHDEALASLAGGMLPSRYDKPAGRYLELTGVAPRNELDAVPEILYSYSNLPFKELRYLAEGLNYEQKARLLAAAQAGSDRQALSIFQYEWDAVTDFASYQALRERAPQAVFIGQQLTPRHGYDTPQPVDDAGLSELYDECFDISLQLHSRLEQAGQHAAAPLAMLHGHRLRWTVRHDALQALRFSRQQPPRSDNSDLPWLLAQMRQRLSEVHPLLFAAG